MTIAPPPPPAKVLTYEDYMAEGEINRRYDIIDGVRHFLTNPTRQHQHILANIYVECRAYMQRERRGRVVIAACDVLITRTPLRTRQPDVLFISNERLAQNPLSDDPAPLTPAPEMVVEILSPSDTRSVLTDKLRDYGRVDVRECWVISPRTQTVEILLWNGQDWQSTTTYAAGQTVTSITFTGLAVAVDTIFAE